MFAELNVTFTELNVTFVNITRDVRGTERHVRGTDACCPPNSHVMSAELTCDVDKTAGSRYAIRYYPAWPQWFTCKIETLGPQKTEVIRRCTQMECPQSATSADGCVSSAVSPSRTDPCVPLMLPRRRRRRWRHPKRISSAA